MKCYLCASNEETRPYGPRGESICFPCAMKPEQVKTTESMYVTQLNGAGPVAIIGEEVGPYPAKHYRPKS